MTAWTDADVTLLIRWVKMVAPLYWAGASDAAVIATLKWQMQLDLAERDHPHIGALIEQWAPAMHQAAVEIERLTRHG